MKLSMRPKADPTKLRYIFLALVAVVCFLTWARNALSQSAAQQSSGYYIYAGETLRAVAGDPTRANFTAWQVWLYPYPETFRQYDTAVSSRSAAAALSYTRWGILEGRSASAVTAQLAALQKFESAYKSIFGPSAWGRFTFSYPVQPVALTKTATSQPDLLSKVSAINIHLPSLISTLLPSLSNSDSSETTPLLRGYFDQVRNSVQDAARLDGELGRLRSGAHLIQEASRIAEAIDQEEAALPQVRAALPTVKLPAGNDWMNHVEDAGRDGAVEVTVTEVGPSATVQQSWSGGDGSMAGTVAVTTIPYQDIGGLDVLVAPLNRSWTVRIGSASPTGFAQSLTSPERKTATRTYAPVDLRTADTNIYLEFADPSDAQDAYTFFLYHKERRR